jgi:lipase chaperone LimK
MPVHVEFTLHYLIQRAGVSTPHATHRLDRFEDAIARLSRSWRPARPIAPARELRMADETREALIAWVEAETAEQGRNLERLGVYASGAVTDDSVPEGWVRLRLDAPAARDSLSSRQ